MEWRRPIDQQNPMTAQRGIGSRTPLDPRHVRETFAQSPEYRAVAGRPELYEAAFRANAYKERLRRGL